MHSKQSDLSEKSTGNADCMPTYKLILFRRSKTSRNEVLSYFYNGVDIGLVFFFWEGGGGGGGGEECKWD